MCRNVRIFLTVLFAWYRQSVDAPEFPFLGTEPIAVEFANTAYGVDARAVDFLGTAHLIEQWFALVGAVPGIAARPSTIGRSGPRIRALRDAVRAALSAGADGGVPDAAAIDMVNATAAAAPTSVRLDWVSGNPPAAHRMDTTDGVTAVLGRIATCCIEVVADPHGRILRRCEGPDCTLLFLRHHRRRRFCHPSCAHRDRQARYYRRHLTGGVQ
jgi:predicted RNA-binding Zn ribbon-like protein